jgi:hypothetical protein
MLCHHLFEYELYDLWDLLTDGSSYVSVCCYLLSLKLFFVALTEHTQIIIRKEFVIGK